jgi:hypothetical protein
MKDPAAVAIQPKPKPGQEDVVRMATGYLEDAGFEKTAADLELRAQKGEQKYGRRLESYNGRDALVDLYQEVLDAVNYALQLKLEKHDDGMFFFKLAKMARRIRERIDSREKVN